MNPSQEDLKVKRHFQKTAILVAITTLLMPTVTKAWTPALKDALSLDKTNGAAPLSVRVITPAELQVKWEAWEKKNWPRNKWGDGFFIDWGDETGEGDSIPRGVKPLDRPLAQVGTHVYIKPGTYTVTAGLYDFMPTDGHKFYWRGQTVITVH
jgi:hypothetical protein